MLDNILILIKLNHTMYLMYSKKFKSLKKPIAIWNEWILTIDISSHRYSSGLKYAM